MASSFSILQIACVNPQTNKFGHHTDEFMDYTVLALASKTETVIILAYYPFKSSLIKQFDGFY